MDIFNLFQQFESNPAISNGEKTITYKQLISYIKSNRRKLIESKYYNGQKVILQEKAQDDFIVAFLSLLVAGCWIIPVQSTLTDQELETIKKNLNAVIFPEEKFNLYEENVGNGEEVLTCDLDNCGILHPTSGTTGALKYCIRTLRGLTNEGISFRNVFQIKEEERFISLPPMSHSFALGAVMMAALVSGSCIYTTSRFVPWSALKKIEECKITFAVLVPFMAKMMVSARSQKKYDLSNLRVALVGAGALSKEIFEGFHKRFGVYLMSNYGSTETGGVVSRLSPQPFNSIGKPQEGVSVKILDENHLERRQNEIGEVWIKSKGMFTGYVNNKNVFDRNGYFSMGDLASFDEHGNLYIKGRKKWIVNIGGKKVNPLEVEEVIKKYHGIEECFVTGIAREGKEEMLVAFLIGKKVEASELVKHCLNYLSNYKIPKRILYLDEMPRNKSGKVDRNALIEEYIKKQGI